MSTVGFRIIVLSQLRSEALKELYATHPGMSRMNGIARGIMWWPSLYQEIEDKVQSCHISQIHQKTSAKSLFHPWEDIERPWSRIHIDHAGPFLGHLCLLVIDAKSK